MIICGPVPTRTELEAAERRRAFQKAIAAKAADLKKRQMAAMLEAAIAKAQEIKPEAVLAEPDPPLTHCPHCTTALAAPVVIDAGGKPRPYPSIADIQRLVGGFYGVSRADICSSRRMKEIVGPRQVAMYIAKELTPLSLPGIGRQFGGRDHTTALHAVRKIAARVFAEPEFAREVVSLMECFD